MPPAHTKRWLIHKSTIKSTQLRKMTHPFDDCHKPWDVISRVRRRVDIYLRFCVQQPVFAPVWVFVVTDREVFRDLSLYFYHVLGLVVRMADLSVWRRAGGLSAREKEDEAH